MEKGKYKYRLECGLCLDCTQLPSKAILGKGTLSVGDSAIAVEEGNAALDHSTNLGDFSRDGIVEGCAQQLQQDGKQQQEC